MAFGIQCVVLVVSNVIHGINVGPSALDLGWRRMERIIITSNIFW
jgi:hypothetical protein